MFGGFEFLGRHLGGGNSFIGWSGFLLLGEAYDVRTVMLFLFQAVVATFIGSIIAGAVAERMKLSAYVISFSLYIQLSIPYMAIGYGEKDGCSISHSALV